MRPLARLLIALISAAAVVASPLPVEAAGKRHAANPHIVKPKAVKAGRHAARAARRHVRLRRPPPAPALKFADTQLEPLDWTALSGWAQDDHAAAFATFRASCRAVIARAEASGDPRPMLPALAGICRDALGTTGLSEEAARGFFEEKFRPLRISKLGDAAGFLTGYYEPVVDGSRFPSQIFKVPVYRRPPDLVPPAGAGNGNGFPNSGRATRRRADGALVPYYDRGEIEEGALDGRHLEICWLKDPIDLFYIQIQGSGRVRLEDGTVLRINYDAHNGHPYTPVGRVLIERGLVPREDMSMDRIRAWMNANPEDAKELRRQNKSYVFFRVAGLSEDNEAEGAQGVPLTPGRSIAVDKALHVYGTPFFIEADLPADEPRQARLRRLMVAQDTGSAIVGPARADIYYGAGDHAGRIAGRLRHPGLFALLVPRALDPAKVAADMPLPQPRPKAAGRGWHDPQVSEEAPLPRPDPRVQTKLRRPG